MSLIKQDLYYVDSHEWIQQDGEFALIGITDYAQSELGDIVYVEADSVGDELAKGAVFGSVESVKMASDLYMPIAGEVVAFNEDLDDSPELINEDAYAAWIIKVKVKDEQDWQSLLDAAGYQALID